jgi:alpha-amylase
MLTLRNTLPSLASGSYDAPLVQGRVMAYQRTLGPQTSLLLINYGTRAARTSLTALKSHTTLVPAYPAGVKPRVTNVRGAVSLTLPAQSVRVYTLQP